MMPLTLSIWVDSMVDAVPDQHLMWHSKLPVTIAMRSIWYEGGGGANLEWFTISPNKALLNDTANGGLATFAVKPELIR